MTDCSEAVWPKLCLWACGFYLSNELWCKNSIYFLCTVCAYKRCYRWCEVSVALWCCCSMTCVRGSSSRHWTESLKMLSVSSAQISTSLAKHCCSLYLYSISLTPEPKDEAMSLCVHLIQYLMSLLVSLCSALSLTLWALAGQWQLHSCQARNTEYFYTPFGASLPVYLAYSVLDCMW